MNPSAETAIKRRGAGGMFYLLAGISILLVALIAADGMHKRLDAMIPGYYRPLVSLAIAISELAHGTSGFVGLAEVQKSLEQSGYSQDPNRINFLNAHPEEADAALRAAVNLKITDRSNTFGVMSNEMGTVDYDYLAFKLFGYHARSIYVLYICIILLVAFCFIGTFRHRSVFILPSILYLLLLLAKQHSLSATDLQISPLTNSRLFPYLSLYPLLFCLTLIASGRSFRLIDAMSVAFAGVVFAFALNARTYAYWQTGPLLVLVPLIALARILPLRVPLRTRVCRLSIYPALAFGLSAAVLIGVHHWRRDAVVYSTATFAGHEYWLNYVAGTLPSFAWRIPELEQQTGVKIDGDDSYAGALLRIKIKERGEHLEDYQINGWWNERKRDELARRVVFDLWRTFPADMMVNYVRAFTPIGISILKDLGLIALAAAVVSIGPQTRLIWLLRAVVLFAVGGLSGVAAFVAMGLRYALPAARRLSALIIPVSLLALCVIPTVIIMPFSDPATSGFASQFTDARMTDLDDTIWLCFLISACGAKRSVSASIPFWRNAESRKRTFLDQTPQRAAEKSLGSESI